MEVLNEYRSQITGAFWITIQLTVLSAIGALVLGTVLAAMRLAPAPVLNWLGTAYVNVMRNTPLTLIILFCSCESLVEVPAAVRNPPAHQIDLPQ